MLLFVLLQDLRQDERVMQLFGLVNNMLAGDATTAERDLSIARYAVIPLSPNSGLIGYVKSCRHRVLASGQSLCHEEGLAPSTTSFSMDKECMCIHATVAAWQSWQRMCPLPGLICHRWVPNCDTLHALIREYREARKIPLNWEHRLMLGMAPDYDHLPLINKVCWKSGMTDH